MTIAKGNIFRDLQPTGSSYLHGGWLVRNEDQVAHCLSVLLARHKLTKVILVLVQNGQIGTPLNKSEWVLTCQKI